MNNPTPQTQHIDPKAQQYLLIMYALNGLGYFTLITPVIAVVLAYIKQSEWGDSLYRDHAHYIIRTFWAGLIGTLCSIPLFFIFGLGLAVATLVGIWFLYRSAFGAWRIWSYQRVNPQAWLELP